MLWHFTHFCIAPDPEPSVMEAPFHLVSPDCRSISMERYPRRSCFSLRSVCRAWALHALGPLSQYPRVQCNWYPDVDGKLVFLDCICKHSGTSQLVCTSRMKKMTAIEWSFLHLSIHSSCVRQRTTIHRSFMCQQCQAFLWVSNLLHIFHQSHPVLETTDAFPSKDNDLKVCKHSLKSWSLSRKCMCVVCNNYKTQVKYRLCTKKRMLILRSNCVVCTFPWAVLSAISEKWLFDHRNP